MPYVIENDPDGGVPPAITAFNQLLAGFFMAVPRAAQPDYVAFNFDDADTTGPCFSPPGRQGGRQTISGARNCSVARLLHEMGHAMGLSHEQERTDRSSWVTVDLSIVDPTLAYNYDPNIAAGELGSYDFSSIMHYGPTGFTTTGANIMETIPPGIDIGPGPAYSRGDLDGLHRLYGIFGNAIVVDTFPSGLTVIVDGVTRVTPATFNWPMGSTHTLDVPAGAQTLGGVVHVFGRWSSDLAATLAASQVVTVAPGPGTLAKPSQYPAVSLYIANFVRMKPVTLGTQGNRAGVGGHGRRESTARARGRRERHLLSRAAAFHAHPHSECGRRLRALERHALLRYRDVHPIHAADARAARVVRQHPGVHLQRVLRRLPVRHREGPRPVRRHPRDLGERRARLGHGFRSACRTTPRTPRRRGPRARVPRSRCPRRCFPTRPAYGSC
jgi:hypothetical protein